MKKWIEEYIEKIKNSKRLKEDWKENSSIYDIIERKKMMKDFKEFDKSYSEPFGSTDINGKNNLILSEGLRLSLNTEKIGIGTSGLHVGVAGSGKTFNFVEPNILQANCSFVLTGEDTHATLLYEKYKDFLIKQGYDVNLINLTLESKQYKIQCNLESFDFSTLREKRTAIFILVPPHKDGEIKEYLDKFYEKLFSSISEYFENSATPSQLPIPLRLMFDDYSVLDPIPNLDKKIRNLKKYGVSLDIIIQSIGQLEKMHKNNFMGIIDAFDIVEFYGNAKTDFSYIFDLIDKEKEKGTTIAYEPKDDPELIKFMHENRVIIIIKSKLVCDDYKYNTKGHPNYAKQIKR